MCLVHYLANCLTPTCQPSKPFGFPIDTRDHVPAQYHPIYLNNTCIVIKYTLLRSTYSRLADLKKEAY